MSQDLPLSGVRVVSVAVNLPGPLAAARLCELGAEVIKVEPPTGDPLASMAPQWYQDLASGQTVVRLDLKSAEQRAAFESELSWADVLITAMRPSASARLGLDKLAQQFPALSLVEIVGHDGEFVEVPGHDLTYQAAHGTLTPPTMPTVPVADVVGAERAVSAALLALMSRARTGRGECRRIVLEEAAADAGAAVRYGLMGPGTPLGGAIPSYGIYASADGHVALGALEPHFRDRALALLGAQHRQDQLASAFATRTTADWEGLAADADIPLVGIHMQAKGEPA